MITLKDLLKVSSVKFDQKFCIVDWDSHEDIIWPEMDAKHISINHKDLLDYKVVSQYSGQDVDNYEDEILPTFLVIFITKKESNKNEKTILLKDLLEISTGMQAENIEGPCYLVLNSIDEHQLEASDIIEKYPHLLNKEIASIVTKQDLDDPMAIEHYETYSLIDLVK